MHSLSTPWLREIRFFAFGLVPLNFLWEVLQLPLYTIYSTATVGQLLFALLHCTAGDGLIGTGCLVAALLVAATNGWPNARFAAVALLTIGIGVSFTVYSEWHNTVVLHSWTYSSTMPTILKIGLAPLAQWLVIPSILFWRIYCRVSSTEARLSGR